MDIELAGEPTSFPWQNTRRTSLKWHLTAPVINHTHPPQPPPPSSSTPPPTTISSFGCPNHPKLLLGFWNYPMIKLPLPVFFVLISCSPSILLTDIQLTKHPLDWYPALQVSFVLISSSPSILWTDIQLTKYPLDWYPALQVSFGLISSSPSIHWTDI